MFSRILIGCCSFFLYMGFLQAEKPVVVSIGPNCQVADTLRKFDIRKQAFPFDWLLTFDIEAATRAIDSYFLYWLDPQFLQYNHSHISNHYYNAHFNHDFPPLNSAQNIDSVEEVDLYVAPVIDPNFLTYLPSVTRKYDRRIQRLYDLLQSNESIMFMCTHTSPQAALQFVNMIETKFPNLNFTLVVVNSSNFNQSELFNSMYTYQDVQVIDWNIPHVKVMYAYDYDPQYLHLGWWAQHEWQRIFTELGLLN